MRSLPAMPLPRPPAWAWLGLALLATGVHNATFQPWTLDDAFITFRYAENLVAGHGPVYNPGERVEGYTTFLWMALLAGVRLLGLEMILGAKLLGGAATLLCLGLLAWLHRLVPGTDPRVGGLACLLVGTSGIASRWALSGMEVPLVAALGLLLFGLRWRERALAPGGDTRLAAAQGLVAALLVMTRPDAALVGGVVFVERAWALARGRGGGRALLAYVALGLAVFGPWFAWRWSWYGWPLPNTFYVKVGATSHQLWRGLFYLRDCLVLLWPHALAALLALPLVRRRPEGLPPLGLPLAWLGLHTAYVVSVGGDVFWGYRFFAVAIPPLALSAAAVVRSLPGSALLALALLVFNLGWTLRSIQLNYNGVVAEHGREVGELLGEHLPEDAVIAVNIAGTVAWYSGLRTVDMLGLNDAHIAHREVPDMGRGSAGHEKGDGVYVLSRAPDVVIFGSSKGKRLPKFRGDRELYAHPEFQEAYEFRAFSLSEGKVLRAWVRRVEAGGAGLDAPLASRLDEERDPEEGPEEVIVAPPGDEVSGEHGDEGGDGDEGFEEGFEEGSDEAPADSPHTESP